MPRSRGSSLNLNPSDRSNHGFSLIAIMVVGIGVLATLALPAFQKIRSASPVKSVLNNVRQMSAADDACFRESGTDFAASIRLIGASNYVKVFGPVANEAYPTAYTQGVMVSVLNVGSARTITYSP